MLVGDGFFAKDTNFNLELYAIDVFGEKSRVTKLLSDMVFIAITHEKPRLGWIKNKSGDILFS